MFNDVDESLRNLLVADMPIDRNEVDISFERPAREWSSRLSKPTLNLFLFDVRERTEIRDDMPFVQRTANGSAFTRRPARRIDLSYSVTAWAKEPADEHRILARTLACMFRHGAVPEQHLQGELGLADWPLLVRIMPPDYLAKPADFWGVMDNEMRAALTWVATVPMDPFLPVEGPMVRTAAFDFAAVGETWRERFQFVGGIAHAPGDLLAGVPRVRVSVRGTTLEATTAEDGTFTFGALPSGDYVWQLELPDGRTIEHPVTVPAPAYNIEIAIR
ncbi:MAG: DUF4255 domain-containing protein [Chloroflexi bacterium]|nr:DUF4255 domain-containing protein [Chloroflexota bacterium]